MLWIENLRIDRKVANLGTFSDHYSSVCIKFGFRATGSRYDGHYFLVTSLKRNKDLNIKLIFISSSKSLVNRLNRIITDVNFQITSLNSRSIVTVWTVPTWRIFDAFVPVTCLPDRNSTCQRLTITIIYQKLHTVVAPDNALIVFCLLIAIYLLRIWSYSYFGSVQRIRKCLSSLLPICPL